MGDHTLKRFCVEGYRGFRDRLVFDLSHPRDYQFNTGAIKDGVVKDALVYGRNGVGKTNLVRAILDVRNNVAIDSLGHRADTTFLNADEDRSGASFSYLFGLDGQGILYEYTEDSRGILRTQLNNTAATLAQDVEAVVSAGKVGELEAFLMTMA